MGTFWLFFFIRLSLDWTLSSIFSSFNASQSSINQRTESQTSANSTAGCETHGCPWFNKYTVNCYLRLISPQVFWVLLFSEIDSRDRIVDSLSVACRKRSIPNDADVCALFKEWDEVSCPICIDHPHNAVLLICCSHDKGCRSYICDTSYRHSNCLDRFKKLREEKVDCLSALSSIQESQHDTTIATSRNFNRTIDVIDSNLNISLTASSSAAFVGVPGGSGLGATHNLNPDFDDQEASSSERLDLDETNMEKSEDGSNLRCPLCRGNILGWKVVEETRKYLNLKARSCSHESCSFIGNYNELRLHARSVHPTVRPADVDLSRQNAWRMLERQREYNDIVSAIRSAIPGAVVLGDYVIDNGDRLSGERDNEGGRWLSTLFLFHMFGSRDNDSRAERRGGRS